MNLRRSEESGGTLRVEDGDIEVAAIAGMMSSDSTEVKL